MKSIFDAFSKLANRTDGAIIFTGIVVILVLRLSIETRGLFYASAGHPCPIVLRGAETHRLEESGAILGLAPDSVYRDGRFSLQERDLLLLYSDGVTELQLPAQGGQTAMLGADGLVREVRSLIQEGGTANLPARLLQHLLQHSGKPQFDDDCTVVTIEVTRSGGAEPEPKRIGGFGQSA